MPAHADRIIASTDGGDGWRGGVVIMIADDGINTMFDFRGIYEWKAQAGEPGLWPPPALEGSDGPAQHEEGRARIRTAGKVARLRALRRLSATPGPQMTAGFYDQRHQARR